MRLRRKTLFCNAYIRLTSCSMQTNDTAKNPAATTIKYFDFEKSRQAAIINMTNKAVPPNDDSVEKNRVNWNAVSVGKNSGYSMHDVASVPTAFTSSKNQIPAPTVPAGLLLNNSSMGTASETRRNVQPPETAKVKKRAKPERIPGSACELP